MKQFISILKRIIFYPFILCILLLKAFGDSLLLLINGGEIYLYRKEDKKLISDIYELLKEKHKNE